MSTNINTGSTSENYNQLVQQAVNDITTSARRALIITTRPHAGLIREIFMSYDIITDGKRYDLKKSGPSTLGSAIMELTHQHQKHPAISSALETLAIGKDNYSEHKIFIETLGKITQEHTNQPFATVLESLHYQPIKLSQ